MDICNCDLTLLNMGSPGCQILMDVARKLVLVPLRANDGTKNRIELAATFGETEYEALVNQSDASKRFYPTPVVDNVVDEKGDPVYEELESGSNIFVEEGVRTFTAIMIKQSTTMLGKLEQARCTEFGMYIIDKSGNLIGSVSADGLYLEPIVVQNETWTPVLTKQTDKTIQKIMLSFEFSKLEKDKDLNMITSSELGFEILGVDGLLDLNAVTSSVTQVGMNIALTLDFGSAKNKDAAVGFLITDFYSDDSDTAENIYNNTTASDVALTSVTETSTGYVLVFPSQTVADELSGYVLKDGYEKVEFSGTVA